MNEFVPVTDTLAPALDNSQDTEALQEAGKVRIFDTPLMVTLIAWLVRLVSFINLLDAAFSYKSHFINWIGSWLPFEISEGHRFRMFLTSILLMFLASGLQRGKRLAWRLTILGLFVAPLFHIGRALIWPHEILNLGLIILLLSQHKNFCRSIGREICQIGPDWGVIAHAWISSVWYNSFRKAEESALWRSELGRMFSNIL